MFPFAFLLPLGLSAIFFLVVGGDVGFFKCVIKGVGGHHSAGRSTGFLAAANLGASRSKGGGTSTDGHLWQQAIITAMEM